MPNHDTGGVHVVLENNARSLAVHTQIAATFVAQCTLPSRVELWYVSWPSCTTTVRKHLWLVGQKHKTETFIEQCALNIRLTYYSYVLEERSQYAISLKRANEIRHTVPEVWVMDDDSDLISAPSGRVKDTTLDQSLNLNQLAQRYDGKL